MKIKVICFLIVATASAFSLPWENLPNGYYHNVLIEDLPPDAEGCHYLIRAHSSMQEMLNYYGVTSIVTQDPNHSYFIFDGDDSYGSPYLLYWPPGYIQEEDLDVYSYKYKRKTYFDAPCNDMLRLTAGGDTMIVAAGFGFIGHSPYEYNSYGYVISTYIKALVHRIACFFAGGGAVDKCKPYFTDSLYTSLPDGVVLSGDSRLYIKAMMDHATWVKACLHLRSKPNLVECIDLTKVEGTSTWRGSYDGSRKLGLKSYSTVILKIICNGEDSVCVKDSSDMVDVCLPRVETSDTIFINHDSMKVAANVPLYLKCKDDETGQDINIKGIIDSVGYRYRSFWISSENYSPKRYNKIYPRDSSYVRWNNAFPSDPKACLVKLNKDSIYAIGGKLTIDARGALAHVDSIDNRFKINTDSITPENDTIRHLILIDHDPSNAEFSARLGTDRMRAVAWKEYAGSSDTTHCHHPYNPRWNNYWDDVISGPDTCPETHRPCENNGSTATGIMQILRLKDSWEPLFAGLKPGHPAGFDTCLWDSLAWSWKICIKNGKYIFDTYLPNRFKDAQDSFPDSCSLADCDTFPKNKNQEDLKVYGYYRGEYYMLEVIDDNTWKEYIAVKDNPPLWAEYVQLVRKYYYRRPWP
jgi:hypothetical protein